MLNLSHLYSACIQLTLKSCEIIRSVHSEGTLSTFYKSQVNGQDPCTIADLNSQILIMSYLQRYFPELRMIGEEQVTPDLELYYLHRAFQDLNLDLICDKITGSLPTDEVTVWIDPLDGTQSFVINELEGVTCMIGIAHKEKPIFGVIAHPFAASCFALWVFYMLGRT